MDVNEQQIVSSNDSHIIDLTNHYFGDQLQDVSVVLNDGSGDTVRHDGIPINDEIFPLHIDDSETYVASVEYTTDSKDLIMSDSPQNAVSADITDMSIEFSDFLVCYLIGELRNS